jgi:hypothetical protein
LYGRAEHFCKHIEESCLLGANYSKIDNDKA